MMEHSRARLAALGPQTATPPKSQSSLKKEPISPSRIIRLSPQIPIIGSNSPSSLLNKVDVDTVTVEKNSIQRPSLQIIPENIDTTIKSVSTTSQDVTLKLNQTLTKTVLSVPSSTISKHDQEKDDLNFSITDITD